MTDREVVITHLDDLRLFADVTVHPVVSPDNWNVYSSLCDYIDQIKAEVKCLLKEHGKPDCEHAEHDGIGCLGYAGCTQDDEPIDACKECEKYTGNIVEEGW